VAAFRVLPYFARTKIDLPPLEELLDISRARLTEMEDSAVEDPDEEDDDITNLQEDD
jgi:hypothetical protein